LFFFRNRNRSKSRRGGKRRRNAQEKWVGVDEISSWE
jgi:hypothetical protein